MDKRFLTADDAFVFYFLEIKRSGIKVNDTLALFNESFSVVMPELNKIQTEWRRWKEDYAKIEYEWYLTGDRNPGMVEKHAKIWSGIKDDQDYVNSNYGYWWKRNNQLSRVVQMLRDDPTTRRAIIVHYNPDEVQDYSKDTPCNVVLNFYIHPISKALHLTVFARSIDLVYGYCNDQYCFSRLQADVAEDLNTVPGVMTYFITNLHIYEKHFDIDKRS